MFILGIKFQHDKSVTKVHFLYLIKQAFSFHQDLISSLISYLGRPDLKLPYIGDKEKVGGVGAGVGESCRVSGCSEPIQPSKFVTGKLPPANRMIKLARSLCEMDEEKSRERGRD